ncbi:hypothetical protein [Streptomyces sp. NPDC058374]|uniref:hypothetical protein n=1 Tax=Streptomyces sp. NPDC058374 TaxID=3346466 RepID=UPI00365F0B27
MYELRDPPPGPVEAAAPGPPGPTVTWTPWSVLGALAAGVLVVLLGVREGVRVRAAPGASPAAVRVLFWFSVPLLGVVLAAVVQRFWGLA